MARFNSAMPATGSYWFGLQETSENVFTPVTGEASTYTNWDSTEPNNAHQNAGGLVGDIDPAFPGMEVWGDKYFYSAQGRRIDGAVPPPSAQRAASSGRCRTA